MFKVEGEAEKKPEPLNLGDSASLKRALDDAVVQVGWGDIAWYWVVLLLLLLMVLLLLLMSPTLATPVTS